MAIEEPIRTEFLVYGECECGWYCACPEGWPWPKCPACEQQVSPFWHGERLEKNYGYVAEMWSEGQALRDPRVDHPTIRGHWLPRFKSEDFAREKEYREARRMRTTIEEAGTRED